MERIDIWELFVEALFWWARQSRAFFLKLSKIFLQISSKNPVLKIKYFPRFPVSNCTHILHFMVLPLCRIQEQEQLKKVPNFPSFIITVWIQILNSTFFLWNANCLSFCPFYESYCRFFWKCLISFFLLCKNHL